MTPEKEQFSHFASVLPAKDLALSLDFYIKDLGFHLTFSWGEPVDYAVLKRGAVSIHLTKRQDEQEPSPTHTALYIFVHDVDVVYEELLARNTVIINPIGDRDYGMRDFDVQDPEGHVITIGMGNH